MVIKNPRKIKLTGKGGNATSTPLMVISMRKPKNENENAKRNPCLKDQG